MRNIERIANYIGSIVAHDRIGKKDNGAKSVLCVLTYHIDQDLRRLSLRTHPGSKCPEVSRSPPMCPEPYRRSRSHAVTLVARSLFWWRSGWHRRIMSCTIAGVSIPCPCIAPSNAFRARAYPSNSLDAASSRAVAARRSSASCCRSCWHSSSAYRSRRSWSDSSAGTGLLFCQHRKHSRCHRRLSGRLNVAPQAQRAVGCQLKTGALPGADQGGAARRSARPVPRSRPTSGHQTGSPPAGSPGL